MATILNAGLPGTATPWYKCGECFWHFKFEQLLPTPLHTVDGLCPRCGGFCNVEKEREVKNA